MNMRGWMLGSVAVLWAISSVASAQTWKPALHDADELYDAAEDLHDRAQRFKDIRVMPVTAQLEHLTTDLFQLLKRNACATDVVTTLNATGAVLEEASLLVSLSCDLRGDRKSQSELANARRHFAATAEHIRCALQTGDAFRSSQRLPVPQVQPDRTPSWYGGHNHPVTPAQPAPWNGGHPLYNAPNAPHYSPAVPQPFVDPNGVPYGVEVRQQSSPSLGRTLARVLISEVLAR